MTAANRSASMALTPPRTPAPPGGFTQTMLALVRNIDSWLRERGRVADDREMLAHMSERELRDIGIDRGNIDAVAANRWQRE